MKFTTLRTVPIFLSVLTIFLSTACAQSFDRRTPVVVAVDKVGPAVVNINTTRLERRPATVDSWFNIRAPRTYKATSLGSGVIIDSVGLVVTNEHVVRNATEIKVHLSDGRFLNARKIEQTIRSLDLALLQIETRNGESFPHVTLGRSNDIMVGETVIAIGNPFGLENTVTTGVISAKNRSLKARLQSGVSYNKLLQTDASINPGNSGGALVNINGELIGINTAIHTKAEGIGFAIPGDALRTSIVNILEQEMVSRKESLGIRISGSRSGEMVVSSIMEDGLANAAGIKPGDSLLYLGKRRIKSLLDYNLALYALSGDSIKPVRLKRNDRTLEKKIKWSSILGKRKPRDLSDLLQLARTGDAGKYNQYIQRRIGLLGTKLVPSLKRQLQLSGNIKGVMVLKLEKGGPADELGIQRNDIILGFGEIYKFHRAELPVASLQDLAVALNNLRRRRSVEIQIYRRNVKGLHGPITLR